MSYIYGHFKICTNYFDTKSVRPNKNDCTCILLLAEEAQKSRETKKIKIR